jgi:hypothetical protein
MLAETGSMERPMSTLDTRLRARPPTGLRPATQTASR